jgi:hypothetical protein
MTDILNQIYKATKSEQGYGLFKPEDLATIADKSLIETDNSIGGPNGVAARLSAVGVAHVENMQAEPNPTPKPGFFQVTPQIERHLEFPNGHPGLAPWVTQPDGTMKGIPFDSGKAQPEPQVPLSVGGGPPVQVMKQDGTPYAIGERFTQPLPNIPVPPLAHRVGREKKADEYGFDKLAIGESFFVACTPDGFKKLSSVVSNRKRLLAPKSFVIRRVEDGAPWGKPGEKGAGIWRVADVVQSS